MKKFTRFLILVSCMSLKICGDPGACEGRTVLPSEASRKKPDIISYMPEIFTAIFLERTIIRPIGRVLVRKPTDVSHITNGKAVIFLGGASFCIGAYTWLAYKIGEKARELLEKR